MKPQILLGGTWETVVLREMLIKMALLKRFQRKRMLIRGLQSDLMVFCLRIWLLSSLVQIYIYEAKLKSFGLMVLAKEVSRQASIDSALWLLVVTLMQIYNEEEQAEQKKIQNYSLGRKGAPGSVME